MPLQVTTAHPRSTTHPHPWNQEAGAARDRVGLAAPAVTGLAVQAAPAVTGPAVRVGPVTTDPVGRVGPVTTDPAGRVGPVTTDPAARVGRWAVAR